MFIDTEFAKENKMIPLSQDSMNGFFGGKSGAVSYGIVESILLSDITIRKIPVWILPTRGLSSDFGRRIDGIFGTEILMWFLTTLDYPDRKFILRSRGGNTRLHHLSVSIFYLKPFGTLEILIALALMISKVL